MSIGNPSMTDFSTTHTVKHRIEYRRSRWTRDTHLFWMRGGDDGRSLPEKQPFLAVTNRVRDRVGRVHRAQGSRGGVSQFGWRAHGVWDVING